MRITKFIATGAISALALTAVSAEARVNQRQDRQQQRIAGGVGNGSLTARETLRLERQQGRIAAYEARSRADGNGYSWRERYRTERLQDRASRNIYRQKHDRQGR